MTNQRPAGPCPFPVLSRLLCMTAMLACLGAAPGKALALDPVSQNNEHATLRLNSAQTATGDSASIDVGMELQLKKDWHTYWRMPGGEGVAPKFDFSQSQNVRSVTVGWPVPKRYDNNGIPSFGYDGTILFPLDVTPITPGQEVVLALKAAIEVCNTECVPQDFSVSLDIPAGPADPNGRIVQDLKEARAAMPHPESAPGLKIEEVNPSLHALVVHAWSRSGFPPGSTDMFVEGPDLPFYFVAPPSLSVNTRNGHDGTLVLNAPEDVPNLIDALKGHNLTITLVIHGEAIEKKISF